MEQKKTPEKTAYTGRFGDRSASDRPKAAAPRKKSVESAPRKPSGFSAAGQQPRRKSAPKPEIKPIEAEKKAKKPRKEHTRREKSKKERTAQKKKGGCALRVLMVSGIIVLIVLLALILFGNKGTHHQLPIIERVGEEAFAPEQTPIPGPEV